MLIENIQYKYLRKYNKNQRATQALKKLHTLSFTLLHNLLFKYNHLLLVLIELLCIIDTDVKK